MHVLRAALASGGRNSGMRSGGIRWAAATSVLIAVAISSRLSADKQTPAANAPNIIFILADDLGYGDLGCYGQTNFETPHLDQLAAEGMRFTNHYAGSTVCAPSRACLHTGLHTGHVYQRFNGDIQLREDPDDIILARRLKDAGYATAMIGKSGLSCRSDEPSLPNAKGFDYFFDYISHRAAHRYYPRSLWRMGEKIEYASNQGKEGRVYSGEVFLEDALTYLDRHRDDRFYLHLSLQQPHADLSVPDEWRDKFAGRYEEIPYKGGGYRAEPMPKATFAAMIAYLDDTVGQIVAKLKENGIAKNTLLVFSSDNGPMSEGGWHQDHFNSSGPLRGGKRDMYEGGIRVPMIAWWPGTISAGTTSNHVSAFWDFVPTACQAAGLEAPEDLDGISYLPTLLGESNRQAKHDYLYWEFYERGGKQAVRAGDWKGVRLNVSKQRYGPIELYNLAEDLGEVKNVAAEHPEIADRLAALMKEAHVPSERVSFEMKKTNDKKKK